MSELSRYERIAFARVITDLIEADFVVETSEMDFFEQIISKEYFSITKSMQIEAKKMDFAKAVSILQALDEVDRACVLDTLKQLAMSDGRCVPLEAVQIFTLEQVFEHGAKVYSVPASGIDIQNMSVVYIENENNTSINQTIQESLQTITQELRQVGFQFVYIPSIVDDFRQLGSTYLQKIIKYMVPSVSDARILDICNNLCELTTKRFCQELLYKKLGINLIDAQPSMLIKINESDIIDQYHADDAERLRFCNYLQIELRDDVVAQITDLVANYAQMLNENISVVAAPTKRKFLYNGFHRSLFDLIVYGKEQKEYQLVFDISKRDAVVYFESIDNYKERIILKLPPQETTLYLMIVKQSLDGGGLDWREHIPTHDKQRILDAYNHVYRWIGKGNTVLEYKDRTQVHHIKNRIKLLQCVANADMFVPEHVKTSTTSFYKIKASSEYIRIIE